MKIIIILCVITCVYSASVRPFNTFEEECDLGSLASLTWEPTPINDIDVDTVWSKNDLKNIKDVTYDSQYLKLSFDSTTITVSLTEDFKNIEETIKNEPLYTKHGLTLDININCNGPKIVKFRVFVTDTNNHSPKFIDTDESNTYVYKLPMPFPKSVPLESFGKMIRANDLDWTNPKISFTIEENEFLDLSYGNKDTSDDMGKTHIAKLVTKKGLQFSQSKTFTITAMDNENIATTATIKIEVDEENSIIPTPPPTFENIYYKGDYTIEDDIHSITIDSINVIDGKGATLLWANAEYEQYFEIIYEETTATIVLKENLPDALLDESYLALELVAKLDNVQGRSVIILNMPIKEVTTTSTTEVSTTQSSTTTEEGEGTTTQSSTITEGTTTQSSTTTDGEEGTTTQSSTTTDGGEGTTTQSSTTTDGGEGTTTQSSTTSEGGEGTTAHSSTTTEGGEGSTASSTSEESGSSTTEGVTESTTEGIITESTTEGGITQSTTEGGITQSSTDGGITQSTTEGGITQSSTDGGTTQSTTEGGITQSTTEGGTTPIPGKLYFDPELYTFSFTSPSQPDDKRTIKANAIFEGAPRTITYNLSNNKGSSIPTGVTYDADTSTITVQASISTEKHYLTITASESISGLEAKAQIIIEATNVNICEDTVYAVNSLTTVRRMENYEQYDLLIFDGTIIDDISTYTYEITDQYPPTILPIFSINETTKNLQSIAFDREDAMFTNMAVPQFTVTVQLVEVGKRYTRSLAGDYGVNQGINMFETVKTDPKKTIVVVLIEDENDNEPTFANTKIVACYPIEDLLPYVSPSHIIQVQATDKDSMESGFGVISYTTESKAFSVHSKSGIVYPRNSIYDTNEDLSFKVRATDGGGKSKEIEIEVKLLKENEISVLSLPNIALEELDAKMAELSAEAGVTIRALSATVVPSFQTRRNTLAVTTDTFMKIHVYGLNGETVVSTNVLKEKLEDVANLEITEFVASNSDNGDNITASTTGFIAAVSVLAVLLVLVLSGGIAFWYFKLRNKSIDGTDYYEEKLKNSISDDAIDKDNKPYETRNVIIREGISDDEGSPDTSPKVPRRPTGFVFNPPPPSPELPMKSDHNSESNEEETNSGNDTPNANVFDHRKSVTFNSEVQKFQIAKATQDEETDED